MTTGADRALGPWNDLAWQEYQAAAPLVSIVVLPIATDRLPASLHAVANQSLRNIEIIIADDGNSDRSIEVVESLARRDQRMKIVRTEHGGTAAARNAAMAVARGEYVGFVNGGDVVDEKMFEKLYDRGRTTNSDVVVSDVRLTLADGTSGLLRDQTFFRHNREEVFSAEQLPEVYWCKGVCDKIFKRALLRDYNIVFSAGPFCGEEEFFGFEALAKAKRLALVWEPLYHQRQDNSKAGAPGMRFDGEPSFRHAEFMRTTKRHFVDRRAYDVYHAVILPVQFLFATNYFRNCTSRRKARVLFDCLRSLLDQGDYAALGKFGQMGVEPVAFFAQHLAANDFRTCYYWMRYVTLKERSVQWLLRVIPAPARVKAVDIARTLLPKCFKRVIAQALPVRILRVLTQNP